MKNETKKRINLRQIRVLLINVLLIAFGIAININVIWLRAFTSVYIVFSGIVFLPSVKVEIGYSSRMQTIAYYFPMYIMLIPLVANNKLFQKVNYLDITLAIILSLSLFVSRYKEIITICTSVYANTRMNPEKFKDELFDQLVAIISEEIFFTGYLIYVMNRMQISIVLSAGTFVLAHYINRWAKTIFRVKDYFYIFILGLLKGYVFYRPNNILLPILIHLIYNSSNIYLIFKKRFMIKPVEEVSLFDDY